MDELPLKVARYLRIKPGAAPHAQSLPLWAEALELSAPRVWRIELDVDSFLDAFAPQAGQSRDLMRNLHGCPTVALMAATIGTPLEERSDAYFAEGRPFAGYMLDRMGSWLVEAAMRGMHRAIRREAEAPGGSATRRYSPGYGDLALDAQAHFIRLIGDGLPELSLTKGSILTPRKSVTAVCGIHR